jgi:hypothetical protein
MAFVALYKPFVESTISLSTCGNLVALVSLLQILNLLANYIFLFATFYCIFIKCVCLFKTRRCFDKIVEIEIFFLHICST